MQINKSTVITILVTLIIGIGIGTLFSLVAQQIIQFWKTI